MQIGPIAADIEIPGTPFAGCIPRGLKRAAAQLAIFCRALVSRGCSRHKSLSLMESVALGDRRFVGVIQFEGQRFLVGSAPSSVTLLAHLPNAAATTARESDLRREGEGR